MSKKFKKALVLTLCAIMMLTAVAVGGMTVSASNTKSGTCGENVTWQFDESTATLTISGTGNMENFSNTNLLNGADDNWIIHTVNIENGITSIGDNAFNGLTGLTNITIPNSIASIGKKAFYTCSSLANIAIPDGVTKIGDYAFACCYNLTCITIPGSVTKIGFAAFDCSYLITKVIYTGDISKWCSIDFECDSSVPTCNSYEYDINYEKIITELYINGAKVEGDIEIPSTTTSIGKFAFLKCKDITSVTIADGVTKIGDYAFSECTNLTNITIPDSVKTIGSRAFDACTKIETINYTGKIKDWCAIDFPNDSFYDNLFSDYPGSGEGHNLYIDGNKVENLVIPEGVETIECYAFEHCKSIKTVIIPSTVKTIDPYSFAHCSNLSSVTIPSSVTHIHCGAFNNCKNIKYVFYSGTKDNWNSIVFSINNYDYATLNADLTEAPIHYEATDHTFENGVCGVCDLVCDHTNSVNKATCESGATCTVCDLEISALGHDYKPNFTWNEDNTVKITLTCKKDETHVLEKECIVSCYTVPATCAEKGKNIYTATYTPEGDASVSYSDKKEVDIPALGHDFSELIEKTEPSFFADGKEVYKCVHDGCIETKTVILPSTIGSFFSSITNFFDLFKNIFTFNF